MKTLRIFIVLSVTIMCTISCNQHGNSKTSNQTFPYEYIDSKSESNGKNKMDLYAYSEKFDIDSLQLFCKQQKKKFTDGTFYYLVIFDSKENASFPNNPMTAFYGMDEEPLRHIRAYFKYNRQNGYSKLTIYEGNAWESAPEIIEIQ